MHSSTVLVVAVVLSTASAVAISQLLRAPEPLQASSTAEPRLADVQRSMDDLKQTLDKLQRRCDALEISTGRETSAVATEAQLQDAIARYMEKHAPPVDHQQPAARDASGAEAVAAQITFEDAWTQLTSGTLDHAQAEELWTKARAANLGDRLLKAFEDRVKQNPSDAHAQVQLGNAYLQVLQGVPDGQAKGTLAIKADHAFDKALDLDPQNWEARFTKATALAFWPPIFGKQAEAIKHFEILIDQQQRLQPSPHHADTYLLLGNLYEQQGNADKARETWRKGLERHPLNEGLKEKMGSK